MRKIFLDIGAHRGQTLEIAIKKFPKLDLYIGLEPVKELKEKAKDLLRPLPQYKEGKIKIYDIALDSINHPEKHVVEFYEDIGGHNHKLGSSLLQDKKMRKQRAIQVTVQDVVAFFQEHFEEGDKIIMKIDIEGKEYDVLNKLADSGLMKKYVHKLYAEWHWHKVASITKEYHDQTIQNLNKIGFPVTGHSSKDEFYSGL